MIIIKNKWILNIQNLVLDEIRNSLISIGCDGNRVTDSMFKGIVYDSSGKSYISVNITGIDISGLKLSRNSVTWFGLPSEIINQTKTWSVFKQFLTAV